MARNSEYSYFKKPKKNYKRVVKTIKHDKEPYIRIDIDEGLNYVKVYKEGEQIPVEKLELNCIDKYITKLTIIQEMIKMSISEIE